MNAIASSVALAVAASSIFTAAAVPSASGLMRNKGQKRGMAVESTGAVGSNGAAAYSFEASEAAQPPVAPQTPADSCALPNGFAYEECGSGDTRSCCSPAQTCISAKPKEGDEVFVCSTNRKLDGSKAVRVVVVPLFMGIAFIGVAAYMVVFWGLRNNGLGEPLVWLLVTQVVLSVFLLFSPVWAFGFYTVLLASFVGTAWKSDGLTWWVYRSAWLLQFFQIIAIFGPFETFHVPFGGLTTFTNTNLANSVATLTNNVASCSGYYGGYFTLLNIEQGAENVNPNHTTFGYCTETWLGMIQCIVVILGMVQTAIVFRTVHFFVGGRSASQPASSSSNAKADSY